MAHLRQAGVLYGASVTVTNQNMRAVTEPGFIRQLNALGCRLFFFIDFVPVEAGSEALALSTPERLELAARIERCGRSCPAVCGAAGRRGRYGGCLAAGRVAHISLEGRLEACPFRPMLIPA